MLWIIVRILWNFFIPLDFVLFFLVGTTPFISRCTYSFNCIMYLVVIVVYYFIAFLLFVMLFMKLIFGLVRKFTCVPDGPITSVRRIMIKHLTTCNWTNHSSDNLFSRYRTLWPIIVAEKSRNVFHRVKLRHINLSTNKWCQSYFG